MKCPGILIGAIWPFGRFGFIAMPFEHALQAARGRGAGADSANLGADHGNEYMMIDSTIVRAHRRNARAQRREPGHWPTPRGTDNEDRCDCRCPCSVLRRGQDSDLGQTEPLLEEVEPQASPADKAYDADALIDHLQERQITSVIPPTPNRTVERPTDFALYCERNLIERFFNNLKQLRATAARYGKLATAFLTAVQLVAVHIARLTTRPNTRNIPMYC